MSLRVLWPWVGMLVKESGVVPRLPVTVGSFSNAPVMYTSGRARLQGLRAVHPGEPSTFHLLEAICLMPGLLLSSSRLQTTVRIHPFLLSARLCSLPTALAPSLDPP